MLTPFPIVHAVTNSAALLQPNFLARAATVMHALGPRGALHLRSSLLSGRAFYELAVTLSELQRATGCWLIVNDRVDVARAVGARGIQLASHSLEISEAQIVAPDIPIGTSIHSLDEARKAECAGAAWCVAGTVFETPSHEGRVPARIRFIKEVAAAVSIPVIAIGGIGPADVGPLRAAGAHGVATIRGASWDGDEDAISAGAEPNETRPAAQNGEGSVEPVTRYISAYDADDGSGASDHPDGERSPPRGKRR